MAPPELKRFIRRAEVVRLTGLPESSLFAMIAGGSFPKPFKISAGRVAWLEDDIASWQAKCLGQRDQVVERGPAQE